MKRPQKLKDSQACQKAALRLLKFRPRSEGELRNRLEQKGFGSEEIEKLINQLKKEKLLNDLAFAKLWIKNRNLLRPSGARLLRLELKQKKVKPEIIEQALKQELDPEESLARQLVQKRYPKMKNLPRQKQYARLTGLLNRRGFSSQTIYQVMRQLKT